MMNLYKARIKGLSLRRLSDEDISVVRKKSRSFSTPEIIIEDNYSMIFASILEDKKPEEIAEERSNMPVCQEKNCLNRKHSSKVCHHPGCMEKNDDKPLLICEQCDKEIHGKPENQGHLVLDATGKDYTTVPTQRQNAIRMSYSDNEMNENDDAEDTVDGMYVKNPANSSAKFDQLGRDRESKLRRKRALKNKRHNTDTEVDACSMGPDDPLSPTLSTTSDTPKFDYSDISFVGDPDHIQELRRNSKVNLNNESITLFVPRPDGTNEKEIICALKNTTLREALIPMLENHGLDIDLVNVYIDSSHTPLPINCETFLLGGNVLYIKLDKEKEPTPGRVKSLPNIAVNRINTSPALPVRPDKLKAIGQKRRVQNLSIDDIPTSVVTAVSPHGTWSSESRKAQRSQSKLSNLFYPLKDKERFDQLTDILSGYSTNGLPSMPTLMVIGQDSVDESLFELEGHWSSIVDNASSLTKRQHDHQEAIWELLQTEVHYIRSLQVIVDVFMCVLLNLQQDVILNEIETERMFSNISDIVRANISFWTSYGVKVVQESRETRCPFNPSILKEGFKKFSELFKPYTTFCLNQKACVDYMKSVYSENDLFKSFVVWAEAQTQCNRLKLTDLLVKPMQRLTKYSLLLQAILRKTDDERQRLDLLEMISCVDKFVQNVNTSLRHKHEQESLATIVTKIESYEAVEPPNEECKELMAEYSTPPDLWRPMPHCNPQLSRALVMQSSLKMKDAQKGVDVECLLFTDLFLICKTSRRLDKYRVIKPPLRVDRIKVHELRDKASFLLVQINEYQVPVWAVTFHADTGSTRIWLDYFKKAQDMYAAAKAAYKPIPSQRTSVTATKPFAPPIPTTDDKLLLNNLDKNFPPRQRSYTLSDSDQELSAKTEFTLMESISLNLDDDIGVIDDVNNNEFDTNQDDVISTNLESSDIGHPPIHPSISLPSIASPQVITTESDDENSSDVVLMNESSVNCDKTRQNPKDYSRRNSRSERRYHTADSIQELDQKDRDPAIYKRLSWNVAPNMTMQNKTLQEKTISSDSLRSFPSSSGVSSTGSLHHMFDNEILNEDLSETDSVKADTIRSTSSNNTLMDFETDDSILLDSRDSISDIFTDYKSELCKNTNNRLHYDDDIKDGNSTDLNFTLQHIDNLFYNIENIPEIDGNAKTHETQKTTNSDAVRNGVQTKNVEKTGIDDLSQLSTDLQRIKLSSRKKSQSSNDITTLLHSISHSEVKDGISSVELPKVREKKPMSYAKMQKMKQLILTSDVPASEV